MVKMKEKVILIFSYYLPLQIWTLKICNHYISKTITAMSFKLGQLIENDGENKKKSYFFFSRIISLCRFGLRKFVIISPKL